MLATEDPGSYDRRTNRMDWQVEPSDHLDEESVDDSNNEESSDELGSQEHDDHSSGKICFEKKTSLVRIWRRYECRHRQLQR